LCFFRLPGGKKRQNPETENLEPCERADCWPGNTESTAGKNKNELKLTAAAPYTPFLHTAEEKKLEPASPPSQTTVKVFSVEETRGSIEKKYRLAKPCTRWMSKATVRR
jgi:hypothetical protein